MNFRKLTIATAIAMVLAAPAAFAQGAGVKGGASIGAQATEKASDTAVDKVQANANANANSTLGTGEEPTDTPEPEEDDE